MTTTISPSIFKAYDIRGVVDKTLTVPAVRAIGLALGTLARQAGTGEVVIGRDGRLSGPTLSAALADGFRAAGVDVIDIGMVPTPSGLLRHLSNCAPAPASRSPAATIRPTTTASRW